MPSKKAKALEKAAQKEKLKMEEQARIQNEQQWEVGINKRNKQKEELLNAKNDEKIQRSKEVKELIELENAEMENIKRVKNKKSKASSFDLLHKTLSEVPKTKKQLEKEANKEENIRKEEDKQNKKHIQEEQENMYYKKGMIMQDDVNIYNNSDNEIISASGIDDALNIFNTNSENSSNIKVLFKAFYDEQLMKLKDSNPGLRLSQYNDKIDKLWKQSPMNPHSRKN